MKFTLEQAMNVQKGSGCIAILFFFNLGGRWGCVVNATPRPPFPRERDAVPLYGSMGGPQGRMQKIPLPTGFDPRTVQPVSSRYTDCAVPSSGGGSSSSSSSSNDY